MNKTVLGVIVLVVIAVIVYLLMGRGGDQGATQQETGTGQDQVMDQAESQDEPEAVQSSSLRDLMSRGAQVCTYNYTDPTSQATVSGTVYVSGGKVRMDLDTMANGTTAASHSIMDGNTYYTWMDGQSQYAFKMAIDPTTGQSSGPGNTGGDGNGVDWNQQYDYDCDSWSADSSKFDLPAGVTFMDFNDLSSMGNF